MHARPYLLLDSGHLFSGCPSSCECKEFGEGEHKKILVTAEELLSVPSNLPFDTGAVYVKSIATDDFFSSTFSFV